MEVDKTYVLAFQSTEEEALITESLLKKRAGTQWILAEITPSGNYVFQSTLVEFRYTTPEPNSHFISLEEAQALLESDSEEEL